MNAGPRGQLAGDSLGDAENPAIASSAADHTEVLATRFARFNKGTEDLHRRGTPTYPLIDRPCLAPCMVITAAQGAFSASRASAVGST
jgi:hypothetical protein